MSFEKNNYSNFKKNRSANVSDQGASRLSTSIKELKNLTNLNLNFW